MAQGVWGNARCTAAAAAGDRDSGGTTATTEGGDLHYHAHPPGRTCRCGAGCPIQLRQQLLRPQPWPTPFRVWQLLSCSFFSYSCKLITLSCAGCDLSWFFSEWLALLLLPHGRRGSRRWRPSRLVVLEQRVCRTTIRGNGLCDAYGITCTSTVKQSRSRLPVTIAVTLSPPRTAAHVSWANITTRSTYTCMPILLASPSLPACLQMLPRVGVQR